MSDWAVVEHDGTLDPEVVLAHLRDTGTLALAEALMKQDLADIETGTVLDGTISADEMLAELAPYL